MLNEESLLNRGLSFILLKDIHSINRTNLQKNGVKKEYCNVMDLIYILILKFLKKHRS